MKNTETIEEKLRRQHRTLESLESMTAAERRQYRREIKEYEGKPLRINLRAKDLMK